MSSTDYKRSSRYQAAYTSPNGADALADSLVSYWKLDGDGTDAMGTNDLTGVSTPAYATGHIFSQAYSNDGSARYFTVTLASAPAADSFTVAAWVYPTRS